jgi:hypothetical protein
MSRRHGRNRLWATFLATKVTKKMREREKIQNIFGIKSPLQTKDQLIWHCIKNGVFSNRSGYYLEMEIISNMCNGGSKPARSIVWNDC